MIRKTYPLPIKLFLFIVLLSWLLPFIWTLVKSIGYYHVILKSELFMAAIRNSVVIAVSTGFVTVGLSSWAAYLMTRKRIQYSHAILGIAVVVSMYPHIAASSPLFMAFRELRLINTIYGLILVYSAFSMPLVLWFLYGYFRKIPKDFDEAAALDGAGDVVVFFKIILPQALGALATAFVLVFLFVWNEFFFALCFTIDERSQPISKVLALFTSRYETAWGELSAGAVIAAIPVFILALFTKRVFYEEK